MKVNKQLIRVAQGFVVMLARPLFSIFLHLKIEGIENLNGASEPYIIAPNHTSKLDPVVALVVFSGILKRKPPFCATKEKYKGFPGKAHLYRLLGGYKVYFGTGDYHKALVHHIDFLKNGYSVCIFPEGKISADGLPGEAKGGISFLAHEIGAPIIPVAINGLWGITLREFFARKRNVKVTICKSIEMRDDPTIDSQSQFDFHAHSQLVMERIKQNL